MKRMWAALAVLMAAAMLIAGCPSTPANKKPTANASADKLVIFIGGTVTFDGSLSKDPDGKVKTFSWTYGDGATDLELKNKTAAHQFTKAGVFNVSLTVKDDKGARSSKPASVIVVVAPLPTANLTSAKTKEAISFSVDNSTLGDKVTDYSWNFGDTTAVAKGGSVTHAFDNNGVYNVSLTISYMGQAATERVLVTIQNRAPTANITVGSTGPYYTNVPISLSGLSSGDADGTIVKFLWDFGDGGNATSNQTSHVYTVPGPYNVSLTVTDDDGETGYQKLALTILKDLEIKNVAIETYTDAASHVKANVSVKIDNKGSAKAPKSINVTVSAYTPDKSYKMMSNTTSNSGTWEPGTTDNSVVVKELDTDGAKPDETQYFVEVFYEGNVIDSGWYAK